MGRVKKSKNLTCLRNKLKISKRWTAQEINNVNVVSEFSCNEEVMSVQGNHDSPSNTLTGNITKFSTAESSVTPNPTEKQNTPTGFALFDSYKTQFHIETDGPKYILVDVSKLVKFISNFPCKDCFCNTIEVTQPTPKGYANTFNIFCTNCGFESTFETSNPVSKHDSTRHPFDVNRRVVQAFSSMGKGHRALETFSMTMNMKPIQFESYNKHILNLCDIYRLQAKRTLEEARAEVQKCYGMMDAEGSVLDITVSYDGTWQKRGFTSKYGIGCCIEVITGLVIDFEILSKYCKRCQEKKKQTLGDSNTFQKWFESHKPKCQCNYVGSSPRMEVVAAERIWSRSEIFGFRYTTLVSDGDAKTLTHLNTHKIYGDIEIQKVECLNHVSKRLGTGLRKLVKDSVGSKAPMGGKGHGNLTEPVIKKLTAYYRNGITQNLGNVKEMKKAIFATLSHCKSTDEKPQHHNCPPGKKSWCFYQRAIAQNITPEPHKERIKTPLSERNVARMLPLYQRLSSDSLLNKCLAGKTQNANEALHNVIWSKCPKTIFTSKVKLEIGICEAISVYNTGYMKTCTSYQDAAGVSPGSHSFNIAKCFDKKRLRLSKGRKAVKYEEYRKKLRIAQLEEEERLKENEGMTYGSGEF